MRVMARLKKLAEKYDVPFKDVKKKYEKYLKRMREKGLENPEQKAFNRTRGDLKRRESMLKRQKVLEFKGIVIGLTQIEDQFEIYRRIARKFIEKHGELEALDKGFLEKKGDKLVPIYTTRSGNVIPLYTESGEEIHKYQRTIYMIAKPNHPEAEWRLATIVVRRNYEDLDKIELKFFKMCRVKVVVIDSDGRVYRLRYKEPFIGIKEEVDVVGLIKKTMGFYSFSKIENEDLPREYVAVMGDVLRLNLEPRGERMNRLCVLIDPEDESDIELNVFIPPYIPIDFGEDSRIIAIGRLSRYKRENNEEETYNLFAIGIYCLPEFKMDLEDEEDNVEEEVAVIEWREEDEGQMSIL